MSINLLEILGKEVTGGLASSAAGFLGESEGGITKALGAAFPAIMGSVLSKGSNTSGAGMLLDLIKGQDTSMLGDIAGIFSGGDSKGGMLDTLMGSGGGILKMLMGNKLGGVIDIISKVAGIGSGSTGSLLKMAAPFLLGTIGKQVMKSGLNAGGLMDLLAGQKKYVEAAMPSGISDLLGLGGLLKGVSNMAGSGIDAGKKVVGGAANLGKSAVGTAANVGSAAVDTAAKTGGSLLKWLIPALLVLGLLSYFFGFKTGCGAVDNVTDAAVNTTKSVAHGAGDMAKGAANGVKAVGNAATDAAGHAANAVSKGFGAIFATVDAAAKKTLDAMKFTSGSAADQFSKYIAGGAKGNGLFRFEHLKFATGSAVIDKASGSSVDHIAAIMKAYPGVRIAVEGHTDKTGDAAKNMKLSNDRAASVRGRLIAAGIDAKRIVAKGYGSVKPVSATATNAENRRIEVRVIK